MKKTLTGLLALLATGTALFAADNNPPAFLVVNVRDVYNNYYRAQEAQEKLQVVIDAAQTELNKMMDEGMALAKSLEEIQVKLNNPGLTEDAKQKYLDQAKPKAEELQKRETEINKFRQEKQNQFNERRQSMLTLYLGEISDAANKLAKQKNAKYILTSDAVVFAAPEADVTKDLITLINADKVVDKKDAKAPAKK